jgi:hypothetical protein
MVRRLGERVARGRRQLAAALLAGLVLVAVNGPAAATTDPARLGITAVGQKSIFFDLSMTPGEKRNLSAQLINAGSESIAALTYAANVYTIVNGGLGVELRGHTAAGTTTWVDYPTGTIQLQPAKPVQRQFTVSVPADATPGDYITSLVLENENPIEGSGGVALNQIVRHALAIAIAIAGPRFPALDITSAAHTFVGGRSVVGIAVENQGNSKLKPVGEFHLFDASRREIDHSAVTMDTVFAKTATHVEIPLAGPLQPGRYTAILALGDTATGFSVTSRSLPFEVVGSAGVIGGPPGLKAVQQPLGAGLPAWLLAAGIGAAVLTGVLGALAVPVLWRRRRR